MESTVNWTDLYPMAMCWCTQETSQTLVKPTRCKLSTLTTALAPASCDITSSSAACFLRFIGETDQVQDLHDWLCELPHRWKVVIAGNHDLTMDTEHYELRGRDRFHGGQGYDPASTRRILQESDSVIYLEDSVCAIPTNDGHSIKVYGSPHQPEVHPPQPIKGVRGRERCACSSATGLSTCLAGNRRCRKQSKYQRRLMC